MTAPTTAPQRPPSAPPLCRGLGRSGNSPVSNGSSPRSPTWPTMHWSRGTSAGAPSPPRTSSRSRGPLSTCGSRARSTFSMTSRTTLTSRPTDARLSGRSSRAWRAFSESRQAYCQIRLPGLGSSERKRARSSVRLAVRLAGWPYKEHLAFNQVVGGSNEPPRANREVAPDVPRARPVPRRTA